MSQHTLFPNSRVPESMALSTSQIEIEGMRVLFDEKVSLFPVEVEEKNESVEVRPSSRRTKRDR